VLFLPHDSGRLPDRSTPGLTLLADFFELELIFHPKAFPLKLDTAGLLGSQAVAKSYSSAGTAVKAMLQLDMTAWVQSGTSYTIGFVTDRTNAALNVFTKMLVSTYVSGVTIKDDYCGYACSDHASWDTLGYPATYPFEAITETENPNMHVPADTDQHAEFSYAHMHHFSQLLVAFYIELAS